MGKNYVESSLKRFLKRKVKITMGFVVAFMIMGTVGFATELSTGTITKSYGDGSYTVSGEEVTITNNNGNVFSGSNSALLVVEVKENQTLNLIASGGENEGVIYNTKINGTGTVSLINNNGNGLGTGTNTITADKVNITAKGDSVKGISGYGTNLITAREVNIYSDDDGVHYGGENGGGLVVENFDVLNITGKNGYGIQNAANSQQTTGVHLLGNENSVINITTLDTKKRSAIRNQADNTIEVKGGEVILNGTGVDFKDNYGGVINASAGTIDINAKKSIVINCVEFDENGNPIKIKTDGTAILGTKTGKINLNAQDKENVESSVIINGNVDLRGTSTLDATLNGTESVLNGKIETENSASSNIKFSNGATWNNTGDSSATNLDLNGGVVNNSSVDNDITVETLSGAGGSFRMAAQIGEDGKATSGKVTIGNANDNTQLNVTYTNAGTVEGDGEQAKEYFKDLANNITVTNGKITGNAKLEEGFVSGGYEADFTSQNGNTTVENVTSTGTNSMVEGIRDLATINLLTWRQEMNSLNKRMGELRNSTGEHGVWSRVYTGKIENGSKYDNDYQTYQVGYDKKYTVDNGVMFVGGLVSYTDGETDYTLGHGENYSVGAGIYATWLNNDGQFADVVLKQSRLHNKFDVRSKDLDKSQSGDYNNWGTSLSGQYGKRFDLNDKFFLEPSVELTLGRVDDTTYTTSAGVDVHQDTMYSLVGNVGTSVGYKFSDKGNIYARAALVKEFQGDIDTEYEKDGALERTSEDLEDTWAEFGVGVNYRFVENMNVYIDVQKTGEATVDTKWQANLGFRYEF